MGRTERPVDPTRGPLEHLAHDLRLLRRAAGNPPYRALARQAHYSFTVLAQAASGQELPTLEVVVAYVRACRGDTGEWTDRWHRVAAELAGEQSAAAENGVVDPPYRGLVPYRPADNPWFFGREKLTGELVEKIGTGQFVALFGSSGSGKSSTLGAGLIPALTARNPELRVVGLVPGEHPLRALADGLGGSVEDIATSVPDGDLLLLVDQFEEIFTLCAEDEERAAFLDALLGVATDPERTTRVVIGMRAEFYGRCADHPRLVDALRDRQVLVEPMSPEELRSAIVGPAARAGLTVDAGLVGRAIADVVRGGGAGALPLLSHALLQTWQRCSGTALTLDDYRAAGGLTGAIARTADQVYDSCAASQTLPVKQAFVRLTAGGDGPDDVRRRVPRTELLDATGIDPAVLDRLVAERLLTADAGGIEIAHEALIREWPALRAWLDEDRDGLRLHRALTAAAADWVGLGRDPGALWRGARLNAAREWIAGGGLGLTADERTFVQAGTERERGELATARRSNRRLRVLAVVLAATVLLVVGSGAVAVQQAQVAQHQRDVSTAERLGVQAGALVDQQPLSLLLAMESLRLVPNATADAALLAGLLDTRHNSIELLGHRGIVYAVAFTPDGRSVFTAGEDRVIMQWDTGSAAPLATSPELHTDPVTALAVSPDATTLVSASDDTTLRRWDVATGAPIEPALIGHRDHVKAVAISPDASMIVSASLDREIRRWDARTGRPIGEPLRGHTGEVWAVAISPDGSVIVSGGDGGVVRSWDATTGAVLRESAADGDARVRALAVSTAGVVLAGGEDGLVRRLGITDLAPIGPPLAGHESAVRGVAVTPDGRTAVTAGGDGTVRRWNVADGAPVGPVLSGHSDQVNAVAASPDAAMLATAARDRTARLWSAEPPRPIGPTVPEADQVARMAVSHDHSQLAWSGKDGVLRRWDLRRDVALEPSPVRHIDEIRAIEYSSDDSMIVTGAEDNMVRRWDARTGVSLGPAMAGHPEEVSRVAITRDGAVIASGGFDGTVRRWDGRTGAPLGDPLVADGGDVSSIVISPDDVLFVATYDLIWRWDARSGETVGPPLRHKGHIEAITVSPDGAMLVAGGADRVVRRWDAITGEPLGEPLVGHSTRIIRVGFTPDGREIVTVDEDGGVRRWDRATGVPVGRSLADYGEFVYRRALSADATTLGAATSGGQMQVFPTDPQAWQEHACRIVGRNLTVAEWQRYRGADVPYVCTCPDLPGPQAR